MEDGPGMGGGVGGGGREVSLQNCKLKNCRLATIVILFSVCLPFYDVLPDAIASFLFQDLQMKRGFQRLHLTQHK